MTKRLWVIYTYTCSPMFSIDVVASALDDPYLLIVGSHYCVMRLAYAFHMPRQILSVWWLVQGLLMFWIPFRVKFPPLVLDLFLAFKLIMLSPSSRAASCHFRVLYPLRLRRHTSQAFWFDVFWLLAWQIPWGLLGWFLDVTSST